MAVAQLASLIQIDMSDARRALQWANWDQELAIEKAFSEIADAQACQGIEHNSEASASEVSGAQAMEPPASPTTVKDPAWSAVESPAQTHSAVASAVAAEHASEAEAFRSESSDEHRPRR